MERWPFTRFQFLVVNFNTVWSTIRIMHGREIISWLGASFPGYQYKIRPKRSCFFSLIDWYIHLIIDKILVSAYYTPRINMLKNICETKQNSLLFRILAFALDSCHAIHCIAFISGSILSRRFQSPHLDKTNISSKREECYPFMHAMRTPHFRL